MRIVSSSSTPFIMTKHNHWTRHLSTSTVLNLATLGPIGYLKAPGTCGSFLGLLFYIAILHQMHPLPSFILMALMLYLGVAICGEAEIRINHKDPSEIVLDEFVAIPLCFIWLEDDMAKYSTLLVLFLGFVLYRFFDIKKPYFINKLQFVRGGWGIVIDDIAAAVVTNVILHILFFGLDFFLG